MSEKLVAVSCGAFSFQKHSNSHFEIVAQPSRLRVRAASRRSRHHRGGDARRTRRRGRLRYLKTRIAVKNTGAVEFKKFSLRFSKTADVDDAVVMIPIFFSESCATVFRACAAMNDASVRGKIISGNP